MEPKTRLKPRRGSSWLYSSFDLLFHLEKQWYKRGMEEEDRRASNKQQTQDWHFKGVKIPLLYYLFVTRGCKRRCTPGKGIENNLFILTSKEWWKHKGRRSRALEFRRDRPPPFRRSPISTLSAHLDLFSFKLSWKLNRIECKLISYADVLSTLGRILAKSFGHS